MFRLPSPRHNHQYNLTFRQCEETLERGVDGGTDDVIDEIVQSDIHTVHVAVAVVGGLALAHVLALNDMLALANMAAGQFIMTLRVRIITDDIE